MLENKKTSGFSHCMKVIGKKFLSVRELTILLILVLSCAGLALASDSFLTITNFRAIFTGASYEMIVCAAMTIALIGGI